MPTALSHTLAQTWPPFVLIAGLLLVGVVAASDRLFEAAGTLAARLPGGGLVLFTSLMALVIVVTVILNLDTSMVFLTPILLHAARRRHLGETAFLYGAVFMSNSASLLLPGSNLTNLLVLHGGNVSGGSFAAGMAPAWAAAVVVTMAVLVVWRRADLKATTREEIEPVSPQWGAGMIGVIGATVMVLMLPDPALSVFGLGVAVLVVQRATGRLALPEAARARQSGPLGRTVHGGGGAGCAGCAGPGVGSAGTPHGFGRGRRLGVDRHRFLLPGQQPARRGALVIELAPASQSTPHRTRPGTNPGGHRVALGHLLASGGEAGGGQPVGANL